MILKINRMLLISEKVNVKTNSFFYERTRKNKSATRRQVDTGEINTLFDASEKSAENHDSSTNDEL